MSNFKNDYDQNLVGTVNQKIRIQIFGILNPKSTNTPGNLILIYKLYKFNKLDKLIFKYFRNKMKNMQLQQINIYFSFRQFLIL